MKLAKETNHAGSSFFQELERIKGCVQFIEKNPQTISSIEDTSMNFGVPDQSIAQQICNIEYQALEATQSIVLANHDDDKTVMMI